MKRVKDMVLFLTNVLYRIKWRKYGRKFGSVGTDLVVYGKPIISQPRNIVIGHNVHINDSVVLNATSSQIVIGDNVTLSQGCMVISATYDVNSFMNDERCHISKETHIGNNNWICAGAMILPGVHLRGHHIIVAAGSIVTEDVNENYVLVSGNPGRICKRYR